MSKHTPGPWMVAAESGEFFVTGPDYELLYGEANAVLMAAAPDMLAALKAVIDDLGAVRNMDPDTMALIRSALSKAEQVNE